MKIIVDRTVLQDPDFYYAAIEVTPLKFNYILKDGTMSGSTRANEINNGCFKTLAALLKLLEDYEWHSNHEVYLGEHVTRHITESLLIPERWTQGSLAENRKGEPTVVRDPEACKFCLYGAMLHEYGYDIGNQLLNVVVQPALKRRFKVATPVGTFNDKNELEVVRDFAKELNL